MFLKDSLVYCKLPCIKQEYCRAKYLSHAKNCEHYKRIGGVENEGDKREIDAGQIFNSDYRKY